MRPFYDHPSAWKASEMDKASITQTLTHSHIEALERALRRVVSKGLQVEQITRQDFPLDSIQSSVDRWIDEVQEGRGIILLDGLPLDRYSQKECEILFYGLGTHFGEPQYQSPMGDRLGHVVNIGDKDMRERAYRNSVELALHTDASDIISTMCLVKAKQGGASGYCSAAAVYNHLLNEYPPAILDTLFKGFRYHLFGEQKRGEPPITDHKVPVFSFAQGYLSVHYLRSYIELAYEELQQRKSDAETAALDAFDRVSHSPEFRLDFMLEPGELTIFNNYVVLHTRTEFFDDPDPDRRRHLLRLWLKAWNPRPLSNGVGAYGNRKGIEKQDGIGTYYQGEAAYFESLTPDSSRR